MVKRVLKIGVVSSVVVLLLASCVLFRNESDPVVYAVGDTGPAGGIVFYDKGSFSDGWQYLEAAPSDQSTGAKWGGFGTIVGGTSTAIGTGEENTSAIVSAYGNAEPYENQTEYAAKLCYNLVLEGYSDWFLPSKDTLNLMYQQKGVIGGFSTPSYWSSSEYDSSSAWYQWFATGGPGDEHKDFYEYVRAVRAF
jgi:hypothetical protein